MKKFFAGIIRPENPYRMALTFLIPFVVILGVLFFLLVTWEKDRIVREQVSNLRHIARAFFEQIQVNRAWNTMHGGVYVEVSPHAQPNPFLDDPHRDIISIEGRRYTKINSAYMTRQLSEIANTRQGYKFRIVSSNPINPYNAPDEWEQSALESFQNGTSKEASTFSKTKEGSFFRYIAPIQIEHPCLKCHQTQDYSVGEIKGGISIFIPTEGFEMVLSMKTRRTIISLLTVGIISLIFLGLISFYLSNMLSHAIKKNIEQEKLKTLIELAGAAAHEMRQPMTVIQNLVAILHMKLSNNEPINQEIEIIAEQSKRMNDIIKKMLNITEYKTKDYIKGKMIVDLDESSKNPDI